MTWLASWPASNRIDAGCEAFDSESAALVRARQMTANGAPHVVVYELDDRNIERNAS